MTPISPLGDTSNQTLHNIPAKQKNSIDSGLTQVVNNFTTLSLRTPHILERIFTHLARRDYINFREALMVAKIDPNMRPYHALEQSLKSGNYRIESLEPKERKLFNELLVCRDEDTANVITAIRDKVAVGRDSQVTMISQSNENISISIPASFNEKYNAILIKLHTEINFQLASLKPGLYVIFRTGPNDKGNNVVNIFFPIGLFENQRTAPACLRVILKAADTILKTQEGNNRFFCAVSTNRLIDSLKKENLPYLGSDKIDEIARDFPYLVNLNKALTTLFPE